jgi:hypothetical protein
LGDAEIYTCRPEEWELIPEAKKLWKVLEEINHVSDDTELKEYLEKNKP